jgi:ribonuclease G
VVQIVRAPVRGKGARAGTRLAFPGRYLVLLAAHGTQVGVSRKIEDRKERDRLRKIGEKIRPKDSNLIMRTEAEGHTRQELEADLKVLLDLRDRVMKKAAGSKAPALLHQDLTLVYQVIRDVFTEDVQRLVVDEKGVYDDAVELVKLIAPKLRRRIKLYQEKMPIFDKYGIEGEIDRLLRRKVWLGQGGYISIDQAEAFTAIDVNTGRYTGTTGLEDTIYRTNLEAAEEVARQLRLRDLGGIIVIDFIDMERARHRDRVVKVFEEALKRDRQRTKILHLSPLGLIEMTRKRRGESLMGILTETCPHCAGLGRVRRALTVALKLEREAGRLAAEDKIGALMIRAAPAVAGMLVGEGGSRAGTLEKRIGCPVYVRAGYGLEVEEHELVPTTRAEAQGLVKSYNKGQELTLDRLDPPEPGGEQEVYGWAEGLRVLVDSAARIEPGAVVVVEEVGRSFARAHVKGAQRKAEQRRRGGRGLREAREPSGRDARRREAAPAQAREVEAPPAKEPQREPAPAKVQEAAAAPKPSRRSRRGRRRPRQAGAAPVASAQPQPKPLALSGVEGAPAKVEAAKQPQRRPRPSRRRRPPRARPVEAQASAAPPTPAVQAPPAAPPPKRMGLLRRGARTIARVVREGD